MGEGVEQVTNNLPPIETNGGRPYEEEYQVDGEEFDRHMERPPENGKGQNIDVLA